MLVCSFVCIKLTQVAKSFYVKLKVEPLHSFVFCYLLQRSMIYHIDYWKKVSFLTPLMQYILDYTNLSFSEIIAQKVQNFFLANYISVYKEA